jgi:hypothetical protein
MQTDMHYYAVYVLARLAGLNQDTAKTIAYASQFVDDSSAREVEDHPKGAKLVSEATAHHTTDAANLDKEDQRQVWVPFHFLPGNEGADFYERLTCRRDSALAQEMLRHCLDNSGQIWAVELTGVTAHVYADTFSHYGFSGVSSPLNRINGRTMRFSVEKPEIEEYIKIKKDRFRKQYGRETRRETFLGRMGSQALENVTGALGHAAVFTYPDRPYLWWSFKYELGDKAEKHQEHDNPATYLEGTQKLHSFFRAFRAQRPDLADPEASLDFGAIQEAAMRIIIFEGEKENRCAKWQELMAQVARERNLAESNDPARAGAPIPIYEKDDWHNARDGFNSMSNAGDMVGTPVYRFYQAAGFHRHYVLRELLPSYGLVVY